MLFFQLGGSEIKIRIENVWNKTEHGRLNRKRLETRPPMAILDIVSQFMIIHDHMTEVRWTGVCP